MIIPRSCSGIAPALRGGAMAVIALTLTVAACSYGDARELSALECSDDQDNDGDDLMNCEDPDCQAHAQCAAHAAQPISDSPRPSVPRAPRVRARPDAVTREAPDASADADEDAGEPQPVGPDGGALPCDGLCDASECINGMCRDPRASTGGAFELRILSVEVPDFDASAMCLDSCFDSLLPSFGFCVCTPDPYVEVWRERGPEGRRMSTLIGSTPVASDARRPSFTDDPIAIELMEGDGLELVVMDADAGANTRVYACRPDLSALALGPLGCSARVVPFLPPYPIRAELRPPP